MNTRLTTLKTVLWALVGVAAVVTAARFLRGLGATTDLSDATPWGFWIALDVMSGVALAAGGFVLAATVYIFGREKYRCFVRPAILTALLGYLAVAVGLLYDLGLPWHIWHPMIYPQYHSVLFEVAMCVMLYLAVLALEFAPVVLEYRWFDYPLFRTIHKLLKKAVIPLVIAGIVLSSLHQSSLGSLFLITPYRLHPLWYSPIIWILFLVSAVALGLMTVTAESFFSAWFLGHKLRLDLLSKLGKAASVVLFLYAALRLGDLAVRGLAATVLDGSWQSALFICELSIGALIPAALLSFRRVRTSAAGLGTCAGMIVLGAIWYRFDVCIVAFQRPPSMSYFPSWIELAVSLGIGAGSTLVFIFFVENLKVYPEEEEHDGDSSQATRLPATVDYSPAATAVLLPDSLGAPRRYTLAAVIAAALSMAFLPGAVLSRSQVEVTPVSATRTSDGWMRQRTGQPGRQLAMACPATPMPAGAQSLPLMMVDGNRDGRLVLFPHKLHADELGGKKSCAGCHHQNMPFDKNTSCYECHRDMYTATDIFDHAFHIDKLDGNAGCDDCHREPSRIKSRDTALGCAECHEDMTVADSLVAPSKDGMEGIAVGYMDAMHGLCISCHQRKLKESPLQYPPDFAECANCHRDSDAISFQRMKPYVVNRAETGGRESGR